MWYPLLFIFLSACKNILELYLRDPLSISACFDAPDLALLCLPRFYQDLILVVLTS